MEGHETRESAEFSSQQIVGFVCGWTQTPRHIVVPHQLQNRSQGLMSPKRHHATMDNESGNNNASSTSPFMFMFEGYRTELDEHHDRRERIINASRSITAAAKKM